MNDYIIVGTAGHVDHGKTVLVKALTGRDTDKLKEEKKRGISIELGFAPLELPGGKKLGLVDVPGHERFIRQMLAGVGGMDLVMLVVAADEGTMPQTIEHLDIIDMLRIKQGIIVITKKDLVDAEWLELVQEDVRETVSGTVLEKAPIVTVSGVTGEGIPELINELQQLAQKTPSRETSGALRLPVDRVFSVTGFGTVITGTIWSGKIEVGDTLETMPAQRDVRVRGLQVHGEAVDQAFAGQRTAVNLSGIDVSKVPRGSWLATKGYLEPTRRLDLELYLLKNAAKKLANRQRVRFYLGTAEEFGRVTLLDRDFLEPGESCFAQLVMENKVTARRGDRFVIRNYSPMYTIGGGSIIEPLAVRHKRFKDEVLKQLEAKLKGSPEELLLNYLQQEEIVSFARIKSGIGLDLNGLKNTAAELVEKGKIEQIEAEGETAYALKQTINDWWQKVNKELVDFHEKYPLRFGFPKEELRTKFFAALEIRYYNGILEKWEQEEKISSMENTVSLYRFSPKLTEKQKEQAAKIVSLYEEKLFQPPSWQEIEDMLGLGAELSRELMHYLINEGKLIRVGELLFHYEAVERAKVKIADCIEQNGAVALAQVRDVLGSSRKYVLPLLEYLDRIKFTKRIEDKRILFRTR